ncbi:MAG: hypothetical protein WBV23_08500 [Desulfobaccales bacterium]
MTRRPPPKGRGADIFLGAADTPPVKKPRGPKGRGADVFLGEEPGPQPTCAPSRPPGTPGPADLAAGLEQLCRSLQPSHGRLDRSHLMVMLWLRVALKEAGV